MLYRVYKDRIKLYNSYEISKKLFTAELLDIKENNPDCALWNRSIASMRREWATHNLAYLLKIKRNKTKDCDLNFTQPWYLSFLYFIFGSVSLLIIK